MPVPPDHTLYGPVAEQSYTAAKEQLIERVRAVYTPTSIANDPRLLGAYRQLKRRFAKLFLATELVLDEEPAVFHLDFKGNAYIGPDDTQIIAVEVPATIVTNELLTMDSLDRRAIGNKLVGREHLHCRIALASEGDMALPDDVRETVERQAELLAELYEHVLAGTTWRS